MKKILLSISFIAWTAHAMAILTLTQANSVPTVGEVLTVFAADTSVNEGASGASVTWTYNGLAITSSSSSATVVTASSTPYASVYPSANLALDYGGGSYEYLSSSSTVSKQWGIVSGGDTVIFTNGMTALTYPFTYTNSVSNPTIPGTFFYGTITGNSTVTADGYGTLVINGHTYSNVLRLKIDETIDYYYTDFDDDFITHSVTYEWYDGVHPTSVLEIIYTDNSGFATSHSKQVLVASFATGIEDIAKAQLAFNVYPNPAGDEVNVSFNMDQVSDVSIAVYNSLGERVINRNIKHAAGEARIESFDVAALARGIYMIEISAGDAREVRRVVIE